MELDTFEDGPYTGDAEEQDNSSYNYGESPDQDDEETGETTEDEAEGNEDIQDDESEKIDPDSQVNSLDDQEEKSEEEEKKPDPKDEEPKKTDEDDDDSPAPKDDDAEDVGDDAEDVRSIKAFRDGKMYEIPEDATLRVKVNGKSEKVTLDELRNNYSGTVAFDEKFNSLAEERKAYESEKAGHDEEVNYITEKMGNIRELVTKGLSGEADPIEGFNYLLDLMGVNTVEYSKAMQRSLYAQYDAYSEMTDAERQGYWLNEENKYLVKKQESEHASRGSAQAEQDRIAHINAVREAHGVDEDDFQNAYQGLMDAGHESITPELVAQTAVMTPLVDAAEEMLSPYVEQLDEEESNSMINQIAVALYEDPDMTIEDIEQMLAEEFKVDNLTEKIISRDKTAKNTSNKVVKKQTVHEYESFDDFDD